VTEGRPLCEDLSFSLSISESSWVSLDLWQQASDVCRKQLLGIATHGTGDGERGWSLQTLAEIETGRQAKSASLPIPGLWPIYAQGGERSRDRQIERPQGIVKCNCCQWCDLDLQMAREGTARPDKQSVHKSSPRTLISDQRSLISNPAIVERRSVSSEKRE